MRWARWRWWVGFGAAACTASAPVKPSGALDASADAAGDPSPADLPSTPPDAAPGAAPDATPVAEADAAPPPGAPYTLKPFEKTRISSTGADGPFQSTSAPIDLAGAPFASATLVVDLESSCYPFETWQQNPPPQGHNWPADCDAFDRNFELTLDPPPTAEAPPGIELMRAITPFGGPLHLEIDVTDVANGLPGPRVLEVHISTWSDGAGQVSGSAGGWWVTARLEMVPGPAPRKVLAVIPLYDGGVGPAAGATSLPFEVPPGTISGRIEYRATGHGGGPAGIGCIGPAEEFCQRTHELQVDGAGLAWESLWRSDCGDLCTLTKYGQMEYCLENPCGAIQSVNAPRANWCPGSLTPPYVLETPELATAGPHTFGWLIPGVVPGGSWRLSAVYIATAAP